MKDIRGYEGQYAITSCGKVWSHKRKKFLQPFDNGQGYLVVILLANGKAKHHRVHRLVAEAYIPNPDNKPYINHLNECKSDNYVSNLEWATAKENVNYGTGIERGSKKQWTKIRCVETGEIYPSQRAAAIEMGLCVQSIHFCVIGKQKTAGGYHWERVIEE